ncbi:S-adenosyl-L-methionine-dependent methyltransferase [Flammula alnicola]|nr:S-adenosyl-L-methionine-dependent methyltransferase [Flammula alnicola]
MARRRPTAFEVSFSERQEPDVNERAAQSRSSSVASSSTATSLGKRKGDVPTDARVRAYYQPKNKEIIETEKLIIRGEDPDPDDDDAADEKPIRELDDFSIFDPKHGREMVSLEALEQDDGVDRQFEAAGNVLAHYENAEDRGQEDDDDDEEEEDQNKNKRGKEKKKPQYVRLSAILRYSVNYTHDKEPFYIETQYAWYILKSPSERYAEYWKHFCMPHRIAQLVISKALLRPRDDFPSFLSRFTSETMMGRTFVEEDIWEYVSEIRDAIIEEPDLSKITAVPFVKHIFKRAPPIVDKTRPARRNGPKVKVQPKKPLSGNLDLAVLKPENQSTTCVTPRIAKLAEGYFHEEIMVVGSAPPAINKAAEEAKQKKDRDLLSKLILELQKEKKINYNKANRLFRFAKIMYIVMENRIAHIQWFNHGSKTLLGEFADPQELFLADHCDKIYLKDIVGKVKVHALRPDKPGEYFCKLMHAPDLGTFTCIDAKRLELLAGQTPPDNCPADTDPRQLKDEFGHQNGVAFGGVTYHYEDFVLYRADKGLPTLEPKVTARKVGRMSDLKTLLPKLKDERQLYLTDEKVTFKAQDLLKVIYVPCTESFKPPHVTMEDWLDLSYDHFYLKYTFPSLKVESWAERRRVGWEELHVCTQCCKERLAKRKLLYNFLDQKDRKPLRTLDLFGGVGAFSRGLAEGSGCLEITHAIEISPSAAQTFTRNSPNTIVYNQCANEMLRYIVKAQQGHQVEVPRQKYDDKTPIPPPPKPSEIDVITAGFPCQSHSTLNMYKTVDDIKSNLILTTLSYMDYYSPSFAYFENVPGFLKYSLNARQIDNHRVTGGIPSGGLKIFIRALLDMNYQVRFGQLQAGHYGTPQRRVRFFIIAAKHGKVLPEFPQATHDFPENKSLDMSIKVGAKTHRIAPIRTANGIAHHAFVSVEDAIWDLPRFDWQHPDPSKESAQRRQERREREAEVPSKDCGEGSNKAFCGFQGQIGYTDEPKTRYQLSARTVPTTDIQQYTKCLKSQKVERVLNIPLTANADYRSLPQGMFEWQLVDPSSSMGKKNYRPGAYGRVDKDSVFQTTVTNVDPTAKQCRVLHPRDHRMLTVRELARSQGFPDNFVFEAIGNNVVTMHRQIGNAVPLPVAHALGRELRESLFNEWNLMRQDAITIDDDDDDDDSDHNGQRHLQILDDDDDDMDIY